MEKTILEKIFEGFNTSNVRYIVVGGLAVVAHGYVRLTHDLDIVLDMDSDNIARAMAVLTALDYYPRVPVNAEDFAVESNRIDWIENKAMVVFSMISDAHRDTVVDIFVQTPFNFEDEYGQAVLFELNGIQLPVVSKQRLLEMKRVAGRPKDLLDIEYLQKATGESSS